MSDVPYRAGSFQLRERRVLPWLALALVLGTWEAASLAGLLPALFMPAPHAVLRALVGLVQSGKLVEHVAASLGRILLGWILGTSAGLALGFAMGIFSVARALGKSFTAALFPVPKIALLPLFILWFGIGEPAKVATIAFGVFFPTVISCYTAVDQVPRNLIAMAQSFGVPARSIVRDVIVPGALPGVLAGFRISSSIALILVVAAEMIGAQVGIGAFVLTAGNLMQTDQLIAGVFVLSLLGLTASSSISALERRLLRWR
jgi:ABC-type nitrate/sulfonate/bicarbonate transport system permease component